MITAAALCCVCLREKSAAAQVLPENRALRARLISFLHRLVECLGERLLPYLPPALSALLPLTADASTVSDVCALLSQLAIRYKAALAPLLAKAGPSLYMRLLPATVLVGQICGLWRH